MNVLTLAGRVANNPVRRETTRGVVCEFRLAVDCRPRLWIVVQTWGQMAGRAAQHIATGRMVAVSGQLISESYGTRSGETAVRWYVRATSLTYLDRPAEAESELAEATS